jgi:hypothetical protein
MYYISWFTFTDIPDVSFPVTKWGYLKEQNLSKTDLSEKMMEEQNEIKYLLKHRQENYDNWHQKGKWFMFHMR